MREEDKARSKRRKKLNQRIRELEEELEEIKSRMGSTFIQSDYQKLMELDNAQKACEAALAEAKTALAGEM
jgi:DNA polymerase I-like protein with 3'-5' exonuclease and polymerase domains